MATQTIVKNTTYTLDIPIPIINGDEQPDEINLNTLRGVYINLTNEDGSVTFNKVIDFTQLQEKYSDFGTNPYHTVIKGLHNNTLKCDIIYDNETTPKLVLTYEWREIPSETITREEQYHNIAITSGNDTTNLKIKIEPYVGATYDNCGIPGLVPYATPSEKNMFLKGDGIWDIPEGVKDINVTLDKEIINEQKNVKIDNTLSILDYELIMHTSQDDYINIIFADNDLNFTKKDYDGPGPVSKVDEMRSNFNYSTIFSIDDISEYDGFEFNMTLYPEDEEYIQDYISNSTTQLYYDIGWSNTHLFLSDSSFITEKYTTYFSTDGGASSIDVFPKHFIDISELPSNNETKTFHFTHSSYTTMGSAVSSHWADRHLDFQNIDINITNLGNNTYKFELCWNITDEITESTEIAKINHNIIKNDDTNSTDTVSIFFKNSTETITEEKTNLDISVELELDIIGG